jgi:hypothetical protein
LLPFSKSGDPILETAYATHFVRPQRVVVYLTAADNSNHPKIR